MPQVKLRDQFVNSGLTAHANKADKRARNSRSEKNRNDHNINSLAGQVQAAPEL
jgi:hypothetical protein